jgi:integrase
MATVVDRWHKARPSADEPRCPASCGRDKMPSRDHGRGGRWLVRWRDDRGEQRARTFEKKAAADSFAASVKTSLDTGAYVDPKAGKITFEDYAEQWRKSLVMDPTTASNVRSRLKRHVYPVLGPQPMGLLAKRPSAIKAWIKGMESDLQGSTARGIVTWVSMVFDSAIDDQLIGRNPCRVRSVKRPRADEKRPTPWTLERLAAVADELPGRLAAMVYLGAGCGHRQGELFGTSVDDIDFLSRMIHINRQVRIVDGMLCFAPPKQDRTGKDKTRSVPLPDSVGLILSAHIAEYEPSAITLPWRVPDGEPQTHTLLFTRSGSALDRNRFNRTWRAALKRAGVPAARANGTHVLRHTAASSWLAEGVDIRTVAEMLGHSDPGFTLRTYTHFMASSSDRARKAMDAFFQATGPEQSAPDVHRQGST